jgi:hypothetical protein
MLAASKESLRKDYNYIRMGLSGIIYSTTASSQVKTNWVKKKLS